MAVCIVARERWSRLRLKQILCRHGEIAYPRGKGAVVSPEIETLIRCNNGVTVPRVARERWSRLRLKHPISPPSTTLTRSGKGAVVSPEIET